MKKSRGIQLFKSIILPVFLMTLSIMPLLFVLVKRYFSWETIPFSIANSVIMTGGLLLNVFVIYQLNKKIHPLLLYLVIWLTSGGIALSSLIYVLLKHPLFFLYGLEVVLAHTLIIFIIIIALSIMAKEKEQLLEETQLREKMERQIHSSRVNPHFLFNSLNLMVSLLDDKEKAEEVLIQLSQLLRYTLEVSKKERIPLSKEIESIEKYLFIQKQRFGDRLQYQINGESEMEVPPLILQPLVENSIKHNLDKTHFLKIIILIEENKDLLMLHIEDSQRALKSEMINQGNGLEITKERIKLAGGLFNIDNGGVFLCFPKKSQY